MKFNFKNIDQFSSKSIQIIFLKGLGLVLTYILALFLTNYFPENLVGQYNFSNNILLILGTICLFGANQSIYQLAARINYNENKAGLKSLYFKYLIISLTFFLILTSIIMMIPQKKYEVFFDNKKAYDLIIKIVFFSFAYFLAILNFEMFRLLDKLKTSEFFRSIFRTVIFFVGVLVIYFNDNQPFLIHVFLFSFLFTSVVTTILILRILKIETNNSTSSSRINISYKEIFKISTPIAIGSLFVLLIQSLDSVFIIKYGSFNELAYYSVAFRLATLASIVLVSINTIISPEIATYFYNGEMGKLRGLIFKSSKLNFLLTIPLLIFLLLFPDTILSFFGENYTNAKVSLIILTCGQLLSSFCGSVGLYFYMTGKQKEFLLLLFLSLVLYIILNFILIPKYGITGAAISSAISLAFWNIIGMVYIYHKDKVKTFFRF